MSYFECFIYWSSKLVSGSLKAVLKFYTKQNMQVVNHLRVCKKIPLTLVYKYR